MEQYGFVALGAVLLFLILYWYKKTPRPVSPAQTQEKLFEREARLLRMYQNLEDLMDSFESYVEEEQGKIAAERKAVEEAGAQARVVWDDVRKRALEQPTRVNPPRAASAAPAKPESAKPDPGEVIAAQDNAPRPPLRPRSQKRERVLSLHEQGMTPEDISREMGIAMAEVMLIIGLQG